MKMNGDGDEPRFLDGTSSEQFEVQEETLHLIMESTAAALPAFTG